MLPAILKVQGWTRERFKLGQDAPVLVSEIACRVPFCPPLETAVAFWTDDGVRHQFRLYKPLLEVVYDDIGWILFIPSAQEAAAWECC